MPDPDLGAVVVAPVIEDEHGSFQVMVDPEDHELCLVLPTGPEPCVDGPGATTSGPPYVLDPIGVVESPLKDPAAAPKQGIEGSPEAWLVFEPRVLVALGDLRVGSAVMVLTWLDRARRDVLAVHPRDDPANPLAGVFSTRSADGPNPIGLHRVEIVVESHRLRVRHLEAIDGTPILDVKPVLDPAVDR